MSRHPDTDFVDYILQGLEYGFQIGVSELANSVSAKRNMQSALDHLIVVEEYIAKEVQNGTMLGPFPFQSAPQVHINRFGVNPKSHQVNKWRLITDISGDSRGVSKVSRN